MVIDDGLLLLLRIAMSVLLIELLLLEGCHISLRDRSHLLVLIRWIAVGGQEVKIFDVALNVRDVVSHH